MKKRFLSLICSLAMAVTAFAAPIGEGFTLMNASAEGTTALTFDVTYRQTEARSMLGIINDWRNSSDTWAWNEENTEKVYYTGLKNFVYDYDLEKSAMQRAAEIAVVFDHTRPDGTAFFTATGYPTSYYAVGENIAWGTSLSDVNEAFLLWREDDYKYAGQGHRRNMLGNFTAIGIACAKTESGYFWVQEFGSPAKNVTPTTANDSSTTVSVNVNDDFLASHPKKLTYDDTGREYHMIYSGGQSVSYDYLVGDQGSLPYVYMTYTGTNVSVAVDVQWSIYSGDSVTLSGNTITAVGDGETVLRASYNGLYTDYSVKVTHEHKYTWKPDRVIQYPTCTEPGVGEEDCSICGHTTTYKLTAYDHLPYSYSATEPTCTSSGHIAYWYCGRCRKYFSDSACTKEITYENTILKAKGHKTTATPAKAATCTVNGNTAYWYCSACKKYFSDSACTKEITLASTVVKATGHKTTATPAKAATCTANGNTAYWYCSACKKYFSDAACTKEITLASTVVKATGHKYVKTVVAPTTASDGYTLYKCSVCNDEYRDNYVDKLKDDIKLNVILKSNNSAYASETVTLSVDGSSGKNSSNREFTLSDLSDGTHTLTFSAPNYVTRSYTVNVRNGALSESIVPQLNLIGDANLDGKVDMLDITVLKRHLIKISVLKDYSLRCADANNDEAINMNDITRIKQHLIKVNSLWT